MRLHSSVDTSDYSVFCSSRVRSSCCLICPGIFFLFLHTECLISFLLSNENVFIFYPPVPTWSLCSQIILRVELLLYETLDSTSLTLIIFTVLCLVYFHEHASYLPGYIVNSLETGSCPCLLDISNHIIDIEIKYIRKHYTKFCRTFNMLFRGLLRSCVL